MAEVNTFACDVCGAQKRETNHWWIVAVIEAGLEPRTLEISPFTEQLWKDCMEAEVVVERAIACGEEHVQTLLSRFLSTGSLAAPRALAQPDGDGR